MNDLRHAITLFAAYVSRISRRARAHHAILTRAQVLRAALYATQAEFPELRDPLHQLLPHGGERRYARCGPVLPSGERRQEKLGRSTKCLPSWDWQQASRLVRLYLHHHETATASMVRLAKFQADCRAAARVGLLGEWEQAVAKPWVAAYCSTVVDPEGNEVHVCNRPNCAKAEAFRAKESQR